MFTTPSGGETMKYAKVVLCLFFIFLAVTPCVEAKSKRKFSEFFDDNVIYTRLRTKFMADKAVHSKDIKIKVDRGTVTLIGHVEDQQQINRAIEIAEQLNGVKEVKAYLLLKEMDSTQNSTATHSKIKRKKQSSKNLDEENLEPLPEWLKIKTKGIILWKIF